MTKASKNNQPNLVKAYYELAKPGIIYGNALTAIAGFLFASLPNFNLQLFLGVLIGSSLIIGSACVFNNIIDRDIDLYMSRTKIRALVSGQISVKAAAIYGSVLLLLGFLILLVFTNTTTVLVGLVGFIDYVIFYSFSKKKTSLSTLIGSIAGATPILAGYTAMTNDLNITALLLFLIMVFWQMPHFYAISIYRSDEYAAAKVPVLPLISGIKATKIQILVFLLAYLLTCVALTTFGPAGYVFFAVMLLINSVWLLMGLRGFVTDNDKRWARQLFLFSLVVVSVLSVVLSFAAVLP